MKEEVFYGKGMERVKSDEPELYQAIVALNEANEALIIMDKSAAAYINDYTPYSSGVEIITITENYHNTLIESPFALHCFIDYSMYKQAADEIIRNFNNRNQQLPCRNHRLICKRVRNPAFNRYPMYHIRMVLRLGQVHTNFK